METGRRAKSTRKNSTTHRRWSFPLLGQCESRALVLCDSSREITKWIFFSAKDFIICLRANNSTYRVVYKRNGEMKVVPENIFTFCYFPALAVIFAR